MRFFLVLVLSVLATDSLIARESVVDKNQMFNDRPMRHGIGFGKPAVPTKVTVTNKGSVKRGEEVFKRYCYACHGSDGKGGGPVAKEFKLTAPDLQKLAGNLPDHHFFMQISNGPGDMPQWKDVLSSEQIVDLTAYINSLKSKKKK